MKILTKRQWEKINQTIVDLQLDYNDVCEQLTLAEQQVSYLQDELRRANDIKKPILKSEATPKKGRKPRKEKENGNK